MFELCLNIVIVLLMERLKGIFKDKHVTAQCEIAKSLKVPALENVNVEDVIQRHKIVDGILYQNNETSRVEQNVYTDVEFYEPKKVFDNIHNCTLKGGRVLSKAIYSAPIVSNDVLAQRKQALETLEKVICKNNEKVKCILQKLKDTEPYAVWLFEEHDANLSELYNTVFFKWKGLQWLNSSGEALTSYNLYRILVSPLVGILSPIVYFIIPYLVLMYKVKLRVSFTFYLKTIANSLWTMDTILGKSRFLSYVRIVSYLFSAVFYFQSIFSSVEVSKTCTKISSFLIGNINQSIIFLQSALDFKELCWNEHMTSYLNVMKDDLHHHQFVSKLQVKDFSLLSNFGSRLKDYKELIGSKLEHIKHILQYTYTLDALVGAVTYKRQYGLCYNSPTTTKTNSPIIKLENMKHPALPFDKAVANNVWLGTGAKGQNAIITSPNSSGKSVLIKSIVINILMAQTMGVCCATTSAITPFGYINTQINVPDSTGCESLFEAEMYRCKHNLDTLAQLHSDCQITKPSLVVMDEIFSSTNPVEAVAGAFAVCKKMAQYQNNVLIFTTHFNYLTKLAKEKDLQFVNYRMGTRHDIADGKITFNYKLERGVNKHLLALELLKKTGFDADIIDEAIQIKTYLSTPKTSK